MTGDPAIEPLFDRGDWIESKNSENDSPRKVSGWEWSIEHGEWMILAEYVPLSDEWGTGSRGRWRESALTKVDPPQSHKPRLILHIEVPTIQSTSILRESQSRVWR